MPKKNQDLEFRLRFPQGSPDAFGPGKADLMTAIARTGSIRSAAATMEMSYNRAWLLVKAMNRLFEAPLVVSERGGGTGGGAALTPLGETVLAAYRQMEAKCAKACAKDWADLQARLA